MCMVSRLAESRLKSTFGILASQMGRKVVTPLCREVERKCRGRLTHSGTGRTVGPNGPTPRFALGSLSKGGFSLSSLENGCMILSF